jgi:predicted amidohydrolase
MKSLKIALLHLAPELGAVERNRRLIERGTRAAAASGAAWVISGELVASGYRFDAIIGTDWIAEQPDEWMRRLADISCELGVVNFVSHPERDAVTNELFNSLFVIGRDGRLLGRHRKLHPTPGSEHWASAGRPRRPVAVDGVEVGLLICADVYSALPAQRLRSEGAEVLVSSAAWWPGEWGPNGEWEARTLETGLPLIVCNRTGRGDESHMADAETVVVDRGEKLLALRARESTVFVVDCAFKDGRLATCEVAASILIARD